MTQTSLVLNFDYWQGMIIDMIFMTILIMLALFGLTTFLMYIMSCLMGMSFSDRYDAPYVKTPKILVDRIIINSGITKDTKILELGCGEGRILRALVSRTGASGMGVDVSPPLLLLARLFSFFDGTYKRAKFEYANIFETDFSNADLIYFFMTKDFVKSKKLEDKLSSNIKPGSIIISHWYEIPLLKGRELAKENLSKLPTYFYRI